MTDVNRFRIYFGLILDEATVAATVDFHDATPIRSERQLTMARTSTCGKDGLQILSWSASGQTATFDKA